MRIKRRDSLSKIELISQFKKINNLNIKKEKKSQIPTTTRVINSVFRVYGRQGREREREREIKIKKNEKEKSEITAQNNTILEMFMHVRLRNQISS
jgi:hypothetical protein